MNAEQSFEDYKSRRHGLTEYTRLMRDTYGASSDEFYAALSDDVVAEIEAFLRGAT